MAQLSSETVRLVQTSWAGVLPISDAAASLFYDRLFALDPSTRPLFSKDLTDQKKKLMQTLNVAVNGLGDVVKLVPVLEQLGARHASYMVREEHFGLVGQALLWTLREGLGEGFTPATERAWTEVYGVVSSVMVDAMRRAGGAVAFEVAATSVTGTLPTPAPLQPGPRPMTPPTTLPARAELAAATAPGTAASPASAAPAVSPSSLRLELDPPVASALVEALRTRGDAARAEPDASLARRADSAAAAPTPAAPASAWLATSALVGALGGVAVGAAMGPVDASALARAAPVALALGAVWATGVWLGRHLGAPR